MITAKLKEFLRPNAEKFILFLGIVGFCFFFLGLCVLGFSMGGVTPGVEPPLEALIVFCAWVILNWPLAPWIFGIASAPEWPFTFTPFLLDLFWFYFLSCTIYFVITKKKR